MADLWAPRKLLSFFMFFEPFLIFGFLVGWGGTGWTTHHHHHRHLHLLPHAGPVEAFFLNRPLGLSVQRCDRDWRAPRLPRAVRRVARGAGNSPSVMQGPTMAQMPGADGTPRTPTPPSWFRLREDPSSCGTRSRPSNHGSLATSGSNLPRLCQEPPAMETRPSSGGGS